MAVVKDALVVWTGIKKPRPCFQNAFAYLLAKTGGGFVAPRSRISSQYAPSSRLHPVRVKSTSPEFTVGIGHGHSRPGKSPIVLSDPLTVSGESVVRFH